jgi:hypothetical protein
MKEYKNLSKFNNGAESKKPTKDGAKSGWEAVQDEPLDAGAGSKKSFWRCSVLGV